MTQYTQLIRVLILLVLVCFIGVVGYTFIEHWSFLDSVFMTIITLTTVGFQEVRPLSPSGRVFTIFLLLVGVGVLLYGVSSLTAFIVEGDLRDIFRRRKRSRKMKEKIAALKNHYIICGAGEIGKHVLNEFIKTEKDFIVIERNPEVIHELRERGDILYIQGNADEDEVLRKAGIERAQGLISVLSEDKDNMFTIVTARTLHPTLRIVTKAIKDDSANKLQRAGANSVVSTQAIGGMRIASEMLRPAVVSFIDSIFQEHELTLRIEEARVDPKSSLIGKTLAQSHITQKTGLAVIAVRDGRHGKHIYNPGAEYTLQANDVLFVVGDTTQTEKLREIIGM